MHNLSQILLQRLLKMIIGISVRVASCKTLKKMLFLSNMKK